MEGYLNIDPNERVLAYFASGDRVRTEYFDLPFDKILLIDNCFRQNVDIIQNKVIAIKADALDAVRILKQHNIKLDGFVSINEGLWEGGGTYALNGESFLGYLLSILKDNYLHIYCPKYYGAGYYRIRNYKLKLPFTQAELQKDDGDYISPLIFSKEYGSKSVVLRMGRTNTDQLSFSIGSTKFNFINDTIFNHLDDIDLGFTSMTLDFNEPKLICLSDPDSNPKYYRDYKNPKNILEFVSSRTSGNKTLRIGFTPWNWGKYKTIVPQLMNYLDLLPDTITFYHLGINDFQELKMYLSSFKKI